MIQFIPADEDTEGLTRGEVEALVVSESEMESSYEDMLSEVYGVVSICGLDYDAADALKEVDPVAYRCGYADYVSEYFAEVDLADFPEEV
jgi:hypothetical protein